MHFKSSKSSIASILLEIDLTSIKSVQSVEALDQFKMK